MTPKHSKAKVGRPSKNYIKQLTEDADGPTWGPTKSYGGQRILEWESQYGLDNLPNPVRYHDQKYPKVKDFVEYKSLGSSDFQEAQIIKRAHKGLGKYSDWCNIKNVNDNTSSSIDWKSVGK